MPALVLVPALILMRPFRWDRLTVARLLLRLRPLFLSDLRRRYRFS